MITAVCPSHITCFFRPSDGGPDQLRTGSVGAGIRLAEGAKVAVSENRGTKSQITIDGTLCEASVSELVLQKALPGRGFDVVVENALPIGQGFGMSAAGAIALALCLSEVGGFCEGKAYAVAHEAEIEAGGGLGDVSAIMSNLRQPVRLAPGLPPYGRIEELCKLPDSMGVAVVGPRVHTGATLRNPVGRRNIIRCGDVAMKDFTEDPSLESLFRNSNVFSASAGLESVRVTQIIQELRERDTMAGMCMLGNSIFMESADVVVDVPVVRVTPSAEPARIIQKA